MKSNGNLVDLIEKVKPEIRTLIEKCNTVSNNSKHQGTELQHMTARSIEYAEFPR